MSKKRHSEPQAERSRSVSLHPLPFEEAVKALAATLPTKEKLKRPPAARRRKKAARERPA